MKKPTRAGMNLINEIYRGAVISAGRTRAHLSVRCGCGATITTTLKLLEDLRRDGWITAAPDIRLTDQARKMIESKPVVRYELNMAVIPLR